MILFRNINYLNGIYAKAFMNLIIVIFIAIFVNKSEHFKNALPFV